MWDAWRRGFFERSQKKRKHKTKEAAKKLAGAAMVATTINFWWRNLPICITREVFSLMFLADQWALRVAHYTPWITYWWNTRKWFSFSNFIVGNPIVFSPQNTQIWSKLRFVRPNQPYTRKQGEYESIHRDLNF